MYIDTHAHIYWDTLLPRLDEVLDNARKANIGKMICIGCSEQTSTEAKNLAEKVSEIYFTVGVHPTDGEDDINWENLENMISHEKCVGIGECGFDFFHDKITEKKQEEIFLKQIYLAEKYNKSLIIHTRDAGEKALDFLKQFKGNFVIHCFTEGMDFANRVLEMGGYISLGGIITYPKAEGIREAVKNFPLERIMLETDCPFLSPQSVRGKINEPANIPEIALKISEIKGVSLKEVEEVTTENAEGFFGF